jgi:ribosomal protein S3
MLIMYFFFVSVLQEVGSIIGKKGEIVKRFREEVSKQLNKNNRN